ncbi:DUF6188 family protein [Nocardia harenae]|uniref:DUF6188 family protein n=1 Tax=Nocardia harenae TaxID=358707 RepID=UPI0008349C87|nr:DUF6188 family protein [Nocardia harenae]
MRELPIAGRRISVAISDHLVALSAANGFELQIEGDFELEVAHSDRRAISLTDYGISRSDLESVLRGTITTATVDLAGILTVDFDSAMRLVVPPDADHEAWTLVGPNGYRVVCMPGGELAVWRGA